MVQIPPPLPQSVVFHMEYNAFLMKMEKWRSIEAYLNIIMIISKFLYKMYKKLRAKEGIGNFQSPLLL